MDLAAEISEPLYTCREELLPIGSNEESIIISNQDKVCARNEFLWIEIAAVASQDTRDNPGNYNQYLVQNGVIWKRQEAPTGLKILRISNETRDLYGVVVSTDEHHNITYLRASLLPKEVLVSLAKSTNYTIDHLDEAQTDMLLGELKYPTSRSELEKYYSGDKYIVADNSIYTIHKYQLTWIAKRRQILDMSSSYGLSQIEYDKALELIRQDRMIKGQFLLLLLKSKQQITVDPLLASQFLYCSNSIGMNNPGQAESVQAFLINSIIQATTKVVIRDPGQFVSNLIKSNFTELQTLIETIVSTLKSHANPTAHQLSAAELELYLQQLESSLHSFA
jgi:hypothetical protein